MNITDSDIHNGTFWNNEDKTPWKSNWAGTIPDDIKDPEYRSENIIINKFGLPCRAPIPGSFYYNIDSNFYENNKKRKR